MAEQNKLCVSQGYPLLLGANKMPDGFNFALEISGDPDVVLVLYEKEMGDIVFEIPFDKSYRIGNVMAMKVSGLEMEKYDYNYVLNGKIVLDPYAYKIRGRDVFGADISKEVHSVRAGLQPADDFEWENDKCPYIAYEDMILYKLHVRGYTMQAKISSKKRGTFSGLIEMIPYWKELGINAIEIMPMYEFFECIPQKDKTSRTSVSRTNKKVNFWGYTSGFYFAPKKSYCFTDSPETEIKDFVKTLHRAGIECIMEMYFPESTNETLVLRALQFWRMNYHMDGFHLTGNGVPYSLIKNDPVLSDCKLIFEGSGESFSDIEEGSRRIAYANDGFLHDMRCFLKSDGGMLSSVQYHVQNNSKNYGVVNYMTTHNGFTLRDLVSYTCKHNEANEEYNRDGRETEYSWNCGVEGPSRKQEVRSLRERQQKNAILMMLLSQGVPMLYGGDEVLNSQNGNNNAYCQDNSMGWIDWNGLKKNSDFLQFIKEAIVFRKSHPLLHMPSKMIRSDYLRKGFPDLSFHGEKTWHFNKEYDCRYMGIMYCGPYGIKEDGSEEDYIYVGYNFHWETKEILLPNLPGGKKWKITADTNRTGNSLFFKENEEYCNKTFEIGPRSIVVLIGK